MRSLKHSLAALTAAVLVAAAAAPGAAADSIPERPEQLTFPELTYDAPVAKNHRTTLKNGMVAYLVPDLSLLSQPASTFDPAADRFHLTR